MDVGGPEIAVAPSLVNSALVGVNTAGVWIWSVGVWIFSTIVAHAISIASAILTAVAVVVAVTAKVAPLITALSFTGVIALAVACGCAAALIVEAVQDWYRSSSDSREQAKEKAEEQNAFCAVVFGIAVACLSTSVASYYGFVHKMHIPSMAAGTGLISAITWWFISSNFLTLGLIIGILGYFKVLRLDILRLDYEN
jgi:hypothetical protein